jgi:hypothetical protein
MGGGRVRLTTLWYSVAYYRDRFTFYFIFVAC